MTANLSLTLDLIQALVALAIFVQTLELLKTPTLWNDHGVFRDRPLSGQSFRRLLYLRLAISIVAIFLGFEFTTLVCWSLLITTLLVFKKFRGPMTGGSDSMMLIICLALSLARTFPSLPLVQMGVVYYIAIQSLLSYFISGLSKLRAAEWRNGSALSDFISHSIYQNTAWLDQQIKRSKLMKALSWLVMSMEILWPLGFLLIPQNSVPLQLSFLLVMLTFHLINAYLFGLNRFVYAWLATYPALLKFHPLSF